MLHRASPTRWTRSNYAIAAFVALALLVLRLRRSGEDTPAHAQRFRPPHINSQAAPDQDDLAAMSAAPALIKGTLRYAVYRQALEARGVFEGAVRITVFHADGPPSTRTPSPERQLSVQDVLQLWGDESDSEFTDLFSRALAEVPFTDFYWETPPITGTAGAAPPARTPFECALVDAQGLLTRRRISHDAFDEHLSASGVTGSDEAITFPNVSGDAVLVVPAPAQADVQPVANKVYGSLATFLRGAPPAQQRALWRRVAQAVPARLAERPAEPLWLSTAGGGVPWLHVRLDSRPKYYRWAPYKEEP